MRIPGKLKQAFDFVRDVFKEFGEDRGSLFAAAISFFGLISFIPLVLLAIGVFGYVFRRIATDQDAFERVISFVQEYIPVSSDIVTNYLRDVSQQTDVLSLIGFVGLLWTGTQVFVIIQHVMNITLGSEKRVGFVRGRLLAIGLVIVAGLLFLLSIGLTSLLAYARALDGGIFGIGFDWLDRLWSLLGILVPVFISSVAFAVIYRFSPTKNIGNTGPIIGGITAGVLFEVAKHAFRWYVTNIADFSRLYGPVGSVIVLVIWIYYTALIAVIGAEVASVYARREAGRSLGG